jgi:hypothetical protein
MISGNLCENMTFFFFVLEHWTIQPTAGTTYIVYSEVGVKNLLRILFPGIDYLDEGFHRKYLLDSSKKCASHIRVT